MGVGKDSRIGGFLTRWGNAAAGHRRAFAGRAQELGVEAFGGSSGASADGCGVAGRDRATEGRTWAAERAVRLTGRVDVGAGRERTKQERCSSVIDLQSAACAPSPRYEACVDRRHEPRPTRRARRGLCGTWRWRGLGELLALRAVEGWACLCASASCRHVAPQTLSRAAGRRQTAADRSTSPPFRFGGKRGGRLKSRSGRVPSRLARAIFQPQFFSWQIIPTWFEVEKAYRFPTMRPSSSIGGRFAAWSPASPRSVNSAPALPSRSRCRGRHACPSRAPR